MAGIEPQNITKHDVEECSISWPNMWKILVRLHMHNIQHFQKKQKKIFFIKPHLGQVCVAGSGKK